MSGLDPLVALVVAVGENGVIGRDGRLPWRIPSEMEHFRRVTLDKPVIMGRRTFVSLKHPLAQRDNIVLTRNREYAPQGAIAVESIEQALKIAGDCAMARAAKEIMVIGGAAVYAALLPRASRVYLTRVHGEPAGDLLLPELDPAKWRQVSSERQAAGARDEFDYTISVFERAGTARSA
jgi:dihydrofolate reductase